jgi:hypothetical protein
MITLKMMKIKIGFFLALMVGFTGIGCKKNDTGVGIFSRGCWGLIDAAGNKMGTVCGTTGIEMEAYYNPCSYYRLGEEACWLLDGRTYVENVPEDYVKLIIKCFGHTSYTKVACGYCQRWYTRQKNIYKPTNTATYSPIRLQQLCGDTVHTLFQGRQITLRETTDSLITLEFSNTGYY